MSDNNALIVAEHIKNGLKKVETIPEEIKFLCYSFMEPKLLIRTISILSKGEREAICEPKKMKQERILNLKFERAAEIYLGPF